MVSSFLLDITTAIAFSVVGFEGSINDKGAIIAAWSITEGFCKCGGGITDSGSGSGGSDSVVAWSIAEGFYKYVVGSGGSSSDRGDIAIS